MNTKPILFSAPMIRALLSGRKTQTRRVVKPQPAQIYEPGGLCEARVIYQDGDTEGYGELLERCPYGQPGDLLWCKEVWREIRSPARPSYCEIDYRADGEEQRLGDMDGSSPKWRSPRFMPRRASRLTLALTDVRVERVQDISEEDAKAEGVEFRHGYWMGGLHSVKGTHKCEPTARDAFRGLWESILGRDAWERNAWCWVLRFRVIHANVDAVIGDPSGYGLKVAA